MSVSVCIPVYNGEATIQRAVESVLRQTFEDLELIVLDNASTDRTPDIVQSFDDSRVSLIRHPKNLGATANFNAALQEASRDWLKILCADDALAPHCLERQLNQAAAVPSAVLFSSGRDVIDECDKVWMGRHFPGPERTLSGQAAMRQSIRSGTNLFGEPGAVLFRRETALKAGGFSKRWRFLTDLDLWARLLQYGDAHVSPESLCAFRVSASSWSMKLVWTQAKEFGQWLDHCDQSAWFVMSRSDRMLGKTKACSLMLQRWVFYQFLAIQRRGQV